MKGPSRVVWSSLWVSAWLWAATVVAAAPAQDTDGDGLDDAVEEQLGTNPAARERLETLGKYPANRKDGPTLDVVRVDFGNVAADRWVWAIRFAQSYTFDNATLIVYVDADNDPKTGRKDMGCEWMLSHRCGAPGVTAFAPDGSHVAARSPRIALVNGVLYVCHDAKIKQDQGRSVLRFTVLSETAKPHVTVDSTGWSQATGPGNSGAKPIVLLDDVSADENFERTEGLDLIWQLQGDPANVAFRSPKAKLHGMRYYHTEYRWWAVHGANGSVTVTVPRAGTFHPAVVVYDTAGREAYELRIDGRRVGRFVADQDDRRQRVHFLSKPVTFKGGEKLTFRAGAVGSHVTEDVLLLASRPPVRGRTFEIRQIQAAYVKRGTAEQMRLTWITTWPAACTVEYGASQDSTRKVTEDTPLANHRLYLPDVRKGERYRYRIIAETPEGKRVVSDEAAFLFSAPEPFAGSVKRERIALTVENPHAFSLSVFPITCGVPFARGAFGDVGAARLLDEDGTPVVLQPAPAVRWQDGSVKWLRVSFPATVKPSSSRAYTLEYGTEVKPTRATTPLGLTRRGDVLDVHTGPLRVRFNAAQSGFPIGIECDANGDGAFGDDEAVKTNGLMRAEVADAAKRVYTTANACERLEVEESGPVRVVVKAAGHHRSAADGAFFAYVNRFVFYAGSSFVRVYTTWGNDREDAEFTSFERVSLQIPLADMPSRTWAIGLSGGNEATGQGDLALCQLRDDAFEVTPVPTANVKADRADGWIDVSTAASGLTVAMRDFWQLYPKALRVTRDGLAIDLCPDFPKGTYDECSKLEEIKLYYYLMGGKYKVRRGVQKQHELMLYFHRGGLGPSVRQMTRAFQEPAIAACTPQRYCGTEVFGEILPATAGRTPAYEKVCETVYQNSLRSRDGGRMFGMLNFGDLWGERKVNWSNGEYDHHHAYLLQFIRSADRRWYVLAEKAARHAIDVDTCHYGPGRGGEWIHSMGHTGGYFSSKHEGHGIPGGHFTVSHTWTEGFCDWYALSGDPTARENAILVADYYDGAGMNSYDFSNTRTNGWHLLLTLATYRLTNDPFYLNAARIIVERTLERQTPGGGWHRQMVPGHCHCMPRHRGEANFMLGILAAGLEEYYRDVPDPRVAEALIGGAKQAVKELWVDKANGFRYTSCPKMRGYTGNNDMTAQLLFVAHRLGGDRTFAEIGMRAMRAAFDGGIGSIAHLRWTPHIIYQMDRVTREAAGGTP